VFVDPAWVHLVRSQFVRAADATGMALLAYCFMPDHVHLAVIGTRESSDARRFIVLAKQLSGFAYRQGRADRLWQRYAFERVLRNGDDLPAVINYVLANPVRAGLVERIEDYPFVGSCTCSLQELLMSGGG
jgi:putative transposase